jgi:Type II secretion system (T2SS), protein G
MKPGHVVPVVLLILAGIAGLGFLLREREQMRIEEVRKQEVRSLCEQWADRLDRQTTDTGVYVRWEGETLPDSDPWGRPLRVSYSQGGVAEAVEVRSIGPDGQSHTADDVVSSRMAMNFKGVGTGIKQGAEETTRNAAKGAVRGLIDGTKKALGGGTKEP